MRSKPIITVKVNRTLWRRVLSFAGSGPVTVRTTLQRTRALCVTIHNRAKTISFKG